MSNNSHELQLLRSNSPVSNQHKVRPNSPSRKYDSNNSPKQTRTEVSLQSRLFEKFWALEFLAWCFAAVTLVILIAVLRVFKDKPQSNWYSSISVNTLLNVLTTISSTALSFPVISSIAQLRWLWLRENKHLVADFESFGNGPVDIFVMIYRHPKM